MTPSLRLQVESARGPRSSLDVRKPVAAWCENEADGAGGTVQVATIILTAAECPWRCTMCDLWKHTLTHPTPAGAIPEQIETGLRAVGDNSSWIKLYNSGSFFDRRSIPRSDYQAIASLCQNFDRVIIENHPRLCDERILEFASLLTAKLEIAIGVESLQTGMLRRLNKGMNRDDIDRAIEFHHRHKIDTRAFVLIRPPHTHDAEAAVWTTLTVRHLFRKGVRHVSMVPVRAGNGWLDKLAGSGDFQPPSIATIERSLDKAMLLKKSGVVTVDLWDWPSSHSETTIHKESREPDIQRYCPDCVGRRGARLSKMNLLQTMQPPIECQCCHGSG